MRIYIAHTYGRRHGLTREQCEVNAYRAIEVGKALIAKGHNPYIPNLAHFLLVDKDWVDISDEDQWLRRVSEWIRFCDALLVGEMPPWSGSGVQYEMDVATTLGLPIYYSVEEVPDESSRGS